MVIATATLLDERGKQHEVAIVGESHYQDAFLKIAASRHRSDPGPGDDYHRGEWRHVVVVLWPEPSNPYDRNAVAIQVAEGRGYPSAVVGYLSRADAVAYQPAIKAATKQGLVLAANAKIMGGGEGYDFGLVIRMGTAEECLEEIKPRKSRWSLSIPLRH